jgi:hypothetical protein
MTKTDTITATRMTEILCLASGQGVTDQLKTQERVRYLSKRGDFLRGGEEADKRGTMVYPTLEVYRAALILELLSFGMDVRAINAVNDADAASPEPGDPKRSSNGRLLAAVRGVASGEKGWVFELSKLNPGYATPESLKGRFYFAPGVTDEDRDAENVFAQVVQDVVGALPPTSRMTIDLFGLFTRIIPLVGVPS